MSQTASSVDPDFVTTLKADIFGKYYLQAERFSPETVEREFRKAVKERDLVADEGFMTNLMFLVRKKEVHALRDDVTRVLFANLKPNADVSTMKTLYALGEDKERAVVDDRLSQYLRRRLQSPDGITPSPYLDSADRIGGKKTLDVLKEGLADASRRQTEAEKAAPDDHAHISQLDKLRSELDTKVTYLSRKLDIAAKSEADRAMAMAEQYIGQRRYLDVWAYKELVAHSTPVAIDAVRSFVSWRLSSVLPAGGLSVQERGKLMRDYQIRGVCLLQDMGAKLTPEEQKVLTDNPALLQEPGGYYRPNIDWEAVLDHR